MATSAVRFLLTQLRIRSNTQNHTSKQSRKDSLADAQNQTNNSDNTPAPEECLKRVQPMGEILLQQQLVVDAPKQPFRLVENAKVPDMCSAHDEILIQIEAVGLNPIDWKSRAYGFGMPTLPCVLGRDLVGTVVRTSKKQRPGRHIEEGNVVIAVSTDYRDLRKAAFQQYAVATPHTVCRVPARYKSASVKLSAIGVSFVTASISLGICLGLDFRRIGGPDLYNMVREVERDSLPEDVREECLDHLQHSERVRPGDWIVIWGASSTVGFFCAQLSKRAGLRVIAVADLTREGSRLLDLGLDMLVHRSHPKEAVEVIRCLTKGKGLRYGVDAVGKETATQLRDTFAPAVERPPGHLVCLVGAPEESESTAQGVKAHKLPMKIFHEVPRVGHALMAWLEGLLASEQGLALPRIDIHGAVGLKSVPDALDRVQANDFSGRLVVRI
jgi:NADPH:quinone reductase-like Zn-dependent oxidoreductase